MRCLSQPGVESCSRAEVITGSQEERYKARGQEDAQQADAQKTVGALVGEVVSNIRTVAAFHMERRFLASYVGVVEQERRKATGWRMHLGVPLMALSNGCILVTMATGFYYGFWLIENDPISFTGATTAGCPFMTFTMGAVMVPMMSIMLALIGMGNNAALLVDINAATSAGKDLFMRIDRQSQHDPFSEAGEKLPAGLTGAVALEGVVFSYPTAPDVCVCHGYTLEIPAGSSCALVGPSGAGKSTIVALLQRFYDPQQGAIMLDGVDIRTLNLAWMRSQLGLVSQEPVLFQGTVGENIAHGKAGKATQEEIEQAARMANAHVFITETLGMGYATEVGLRGGFLSGGQKQRVAIARALVREPKVLLLDEATSALDSESEKVVQAALDDLIATRSQTSLTIAHRLSTIRHADQIAVVSRGKIVESGAHDELRDSGGLYAELLAAQK